MFQFLANLAGAIWQELVKCLLRLYSCKTRNQLTKCAYCVGFRICCGIFIHKLEHKLEKRVREVKANDIESALDRLQDPLFLFPTGGILLPAFLWQILVQGEYSAEQRDHPVCRLLQYSFGITRESNYLRNPPCFLGPKHAPLPC
jgi:hypothetical protein